MDLNLIATAAELANFRFSVNGTLVALPSTPSSGGGGGTPGGGTGNPPPGGGTGNPPPSNNNALVYNNRYIADTISINDLAGDQEVWLNVAVPADAKGPFRYQVGEIPTVHQPCFRNVTVWIDGVQCGPEFVDISPQIVVGFGESGYVLNLPQAKGKTLQFRAKNVDGDNKLPASVIVSCRIHTYADA